MAVTGLAAWASSDAPVWDASQLAPNIDVSQLNEHMDQPYMMKNMTAIKSLQGEVMAAAMAENPDLDLVFSKIDELAVLKAEMEKEGYRAYLRSQGHNVPMVSDTQGPGRDHSGR
jgi:hypothetical protein